ncbi:BamA/TamA family outer membrane protein [Salipiger sp. H15]|uniref:BamA/TamA family outer membrane protein n=1 Tax=Alloyangia sp. H15 TaxID=3029062 RepID=A0AAU8AHW0_9RHOB
MSLAAFPASAFETLSFAFPDLDQDIQDKITAYSALVKTKTDGKTEGPDVMAAALSDYGIIVETLYGSGYYGPEVSIRIDGREAADIPLLSTPQQVNRVDVLVRHGPSFKFSKAEVTPLAPGTDLPEDFRAGQRARADTISGAAQAAVDGWRNIGYPKADLTREDITANHETRRVSAEMGVTTGPRLRFGRILNVGKSNVRGAALRRIAGLPTGEIYDPQQVKDAVDRLTRTGTFATVTLREKDQPNADGTLDYTLDVVDSKPRRIGAGAEISSLEGLSLTGYWLHRNILGGAERLRFDASITDITDQPDTLDYTLTGRLDVPAVIGPETNGYFETELQHLQEPNYDLDSIELTLGITRQLTEYLYTEIGVGYLYSETKDDLGDRTFELLTLPMKAEYDRRDNEFDPRHGFYILTEATPFMNLRDDPNGARLYGDFRGYLALGARERSVLAGRVMLGSVVGPDIDQTPPDYLFYSGGAGTVRGQPYQSLAIDLGNGDSIGGRSFAGLSAEFRQDIGESLGAVLFYDAGYIGRDSTPGGDDGEWHAGAGLGVRYKTGIGPLRFDVAMPAGGDTGEGVQIYLGIGQAF